MSLELSRLRQENHSLAMGVAMIKQQVRRSPPLSLSVTLCPDLRLIQTKNQVLFLSEFVLASQIPISLLCVSKE